MPTRRVRVAQAVAGLAVLALLVTLAWLLPSPGFRLSRLALVLVIAAVGLAGVAGTVLDRPLLVVGAAIGLYLLGFWQAVLGVVMVPVAVALLVAGALLLLESDRDRSPADEA